MFGYFGVKKAVFLQQIIHFLTQVVFALLARNTFHQLPVFDKQKRWHARNAKFTAGPGCFVHVYGQYVGLAVVLFGQAVDSGFHALAMRTPRGKKLHHFCPVVRLKGFVKGCVCYGQFCVHSYPLYGFLQYSLFGALWRVRKKVSSGRNGERDVAEGGFIDYNSAVQYG